MSDTLKDLKRLYEFRRVRRREPPSIASIISEVISRRGLARFRGHESMEEAWRQAVGEPGCRYSRVGAFRRGTLEILVANSVLLQELAGFQKQRLLGKLKESLGTEVRDLRFRLDEHA